MTSKYATMGENSTAHANRNRTSSMGGKAQRRSTYDLTKEEGSNEHALDFQTMLAEARKASSKGARSNSRSRSANGMGTSGRFAKVEKTGPSSMYNPNDKNGMGASSQHKKGILTNSAPRFKQHKSESPGPGAISNYSSFSSATKTFSTKQSLGGGTSRDIFAAQERRAKELPTTTYEGKSISSTVKSQRPSSAFSSSTGRMQYQKPAVETPAVGAYETNTGIKPGTKPSAGFSSSTGRMQHQKLPDTPAVGAYR